MKSIFAWVLEEITYFFILKLRKDKMRRVVFCIFLLCVLSQSKKTKYEGEKVYRLFPTTEKQHRLVQSFVEEMQLDLWKDARFIGDTVDVRVPFIRRAQFKVFLATSGVENQIFIDDVQGLIDEQTKPHPVAKNLDSFDYDVYHTLEEIQQWVDMMAEENSDLITKHEVGRSYENREIVAIKVGASADDKPKFYMNCGIHAREWISPATCLLVTSYLVDGYRSGDPDITDILNSIDFIFVPSLNVDGYSYTWTENRLWRKTRRPHPTSSCVGADANRNWDVNFGGEGSTDNPCSSTFHGLYAFSENCTAAQKQFVEGLSNVQMYIDLHSYGQLWMHPYGYTDDPSTSEDTLVDIGLNAVAAVFEVHGTQYSPGRIYSTLYAASGMVTDYFYDETGIKCSYIVELRDEGEYGFLLPENQIRPTAEEVFAGFMVMAQAINDGQCVSVA